MHLYAPAFALGQCLLLIHYWQQPQFQVPQLPRGDLRRGAAVDGGRRAWGPLWALGAFCRRRETSKTCLRYAITLHLRAGCGAPAFLMTVYAFHTPPSRSICVPVGAVGFGITLLACKRSHTSLCMYVSALRVVRVRYGAMHHFVCIVLKFPDSYQVATSPNNRP